MDKKASEADFNKTVLAMERMTTKMERRVFDALTSFYDMKILSLPPEILNKSLKDLTKEDLAFLNSEGSKNNADDNKEAIYDISETKSFPKPSNTRARGRGTDKYKTPAQTAKTPLSSMVTPKFNTKSTMPVLRKPKEGEIVMSMSGSPLHVASIINETKANIVVPLYNGKVLSVLPERGLRRSEIPMIDEDLRRQLRVLKENLATILAKDH